MNNVLCLSDPVVKQLRREHPAFKGTRLLKRGMFCGVFSMPSPDRVLKLTTDRSHSGYLTDWCAPKGDYKPMVLEDYGQVAETQAGDLPLHLLEVERLFPVRRGSPNAKLVTRLIKFTDRMPNFPEDLSGLDVAPALKMFLEELTWFIGNYDCKLDTGRNNFMERADGTLVFSDPTFDYKLRDRVERDRRTYARAHLSPISF